MIRSLMDLMGQRGPFSVAAPLADMGMRGGFPGQAFHPMMPHPMTGGMGQRFPTSGYDSSGINPHGMYNGTFNRPQSFPVNPGGLMALMGRY